MKRGKLYALFALLLCASLLSGCAARLPIKQGDGSTLPPPSLPYTAPLGDVSAGSAQTVLLSLPSAQSGQLAYFPERILLSPSRHPAEYALRRLFTYTTTTNISALPGEGQLALAPGSVIEISGDTATVNLAAGALTLSNQERYLVARAIANTLTQWDDIRYVNLLINGRQPGLDTAATLPLGSLSKTTDGDIASLWDAVNRAGSGQDQPFSALATLYYPLSAGRGIAAETRLLSAPGRSLAQMAGSLLQALSQPATSLPGAPAVPDLSLLLSQEPVIEETGGTSGRVVHLAFHERLNEELIAAGIPRSVMMASLTYTLTTFLPYTAGITVKIGSEQITAVVPAGLYEGAGEQLLFPGGLMQRTQFARFLLDYITLYFANAQGSLSATRRPIPHYQTHNPRFLMNQLMAGPGSADSLSGLSPVLPESLKDADLIGISQQDDTMLVHFSEVLSDLIAGYSQQQELALVYAMVNTLTNKPGAAQVCFFVDGAQEGVFAQAIDIAGLFLRNEGMIR